MSTFDPVNDYNDFQLEAESSAPQAAEVRKGDPYKVYGFVKFMLNMGLGLCVLSFIRFLFNIAEYEDFLPLVGEFVGLVLLITGFLSIMRYKTSGIWFFIAATLVRLLMAIYALSNDTWLPQETAAPAILILGSMMPLIILSLLLFIPGSRGSTWAIMSAYQETIREEDEEDDESES